MESRSEHRTEAHGARAMSSVSTGSAPKRAPVSGATAFFILLAVGLVAGPAAGLLMRAVGQPFGVPAELVAGLGPGGPSPDRAPAIEAAEAAAERRNAALTLAIAGAVLGCGLAAAVGFVGRSSRRAMLGALAGVIFGALFGAAAGYAALLTGGSLANVDSVDPSHVSMAIHTVAWGIVAPGVGVACTVAAGSARLAGRYVPATVAAGILAGLLYFPLVALLLPTEDTDIVIPESLAARILWTTVPAVLIGVTVARTANRAPREPAGAVASAG